jgi:uncharacterized coiled-coil DUF342 family protein
MRNHQWYIDRRISCPEGGYPDCEARFLSIKEYAKWVESERDELVRQNTDLRAQRDIAKSERDELRIQCDALKALLADIRGLSDVVSSLPAWVIDNIDNALREGGK